MVIVFRMESVTCVIHSWTMVRIEECVSSSLDILTWWT